MPWVRMSDDAAITLVDDASIAIRLLDFLVISGSLPIEGSLQVGKNLTTALSSYQLRVFPGCAT